MLNFTRAKIFTNQRFDRGIGHGFGRVVIRSVTIAAIVFVSFVEPAFAEWKVDFTRRAKSVREADLKAAAAESRDPASASASDGIGPERGLLESIFDTGEPYQDIVVLNTERGFLPATVRVRLNGRYRVHVVNVNEKEKNVSFILDGFSEHHSTYYGRIKTFSLEPRKEGVFSFQSPETAAEGKLIVFNPEIIIRNPASER